MIVKHDEVSLGLVPVRRSTFSVGHMLDDGNGTMRSMIGVRRPGRSKKCEHQVCEPGRRTRVKSTFALRSGVMDLKLRPGKPEDAETCGRICYEAFAVIARQQNFPRRYPLPRLR